MLRTLVFDVTRTLCYLFPWRCDHSLRIYRLYIYNIYFCLTNKTFLRLKKTSTATYILLTSKLLIWILSKFILDHSHELFSIVLANLSPSNLSHDVSNINFTHRSIFTPDLSAPAESTPESSPLKNWQVNQLLGEKDLDFPPHP